jgi:hypothetical protein
MAAAALLVALALGLAKRSDTGPLHKEGNPFRERQRQMPSGPKRTPVGPKQPQAGGEKAR